MIALSNREIQVVRAVCDSTDRYEDVARRLNIAVGTLKRHLQNICDKLGADNAQHMKQIAWKTGLAPCPCGKQPDCRDRPRENEVRQWKTI